MAATIALSWSAAAAVSALASTTPPPGGTTTTPPGTKPPKGAGGNGSASAGTPAKPARPDLILSNETTATTWTIADEAAPIRVNPSVTSPRIDSLRFQTSDGFLQSYVLLRERFTPAGAWVQLRIPGRPNGRIGWVPRSVLDAFQKVHTELVVDRAIDSLTLYRNGRIIYHAPVGVGKPSTPTPPGHFWITESFPSSDPFYGPWAFGTSDFSVLTEWVGGGVVGLHGTNEPALIPGDPSHGCVRLLNSDVLALSKLVTVGTPLLIE